MFKGSFWKHCRSIWVVRKLKFWYIAYLIMYDDALISFFANQIIKLFMQRYSLWESRWGRGWNLNILYPLKHFFFLLSELKLSSHFLSKSVTNYSTASFGVLVTGFPHPLSTNLRFLSTMTGSLRGFSLTIHEIYTLIIIFTEKAKYFRTRVGRKRINNIYLAKIEGELTLLNTRNGV